MGETERPAVKLSEEQPGSAHRWKVCMRIGYPMEDEGTSLANEAMASYYIPMCSYCGSPMPARSLARLQRGLRELRQGPPRLPELSFL